MIDGGVIFVVVVVVGAFVLVLMLCVPLIFFVVGVINVDASALLR